MSTPDDWKRIEKLQRLLEDGEANVSQMCELDSLRTEHSPDMAARLRRLGDYADKLKMNAAANKLPSVATRESLIAAECYEVVARKLLALLTGEEGEWK
jgi:hypothetical protein